MRYNAFSMSLLIVALITAALLSFQAIAAPTSGVEILWKKDITLSGTYLLSTLVNRKAKTFGWTESTWKSPPIFAELKISRSDSTQWGEQYFFTAGNLHKDVVYFRIDRNKTQGVPCDPSGYYCISGIHVIDSDIAGNKSEGTPCDRSGHSCISRLQVIDSDTITILLNDKEEYTYYRIDGMTQVGIRGRYSYNPDYGIREYQNRFTPCNAKAALDSAQLTGSESLMATLRKQAQQYADRMNTRYWDLTWPLYVEGNAVFEDSNRVSDRYYRFAKLTNVSETSPADCPPWGGRWRSRWVTFSFQQATRWDHRPFDARRKQRSIR